MLSVLNVSRFGSRHSSMQHAPNRRSVLAKRVGTCSNVRSPFRLAAAVPDTDVLAKEVALMRSTLDTGVLFSAAFLTGLVAATGTSYLADLADLPEPYQALLMVSSGIVGGLVVAGVAQFMKEAAEVEASALVTVAFMQGSTMLDSTPVLTVGDLVKATEGKAELLADYIVGKCGNLVPEGWMVAKIKLVRQDAELTVWAGGKSKDNFMSNVKTAVLLKTYSKVVLQIEQVKV